MKDSPIFQTSVETRLLFQLMEKASVGDIIDYPTMTGAISRPVSGAYGPLRTALRKLLRERNMVFACIKGLGFKRLNDAEIIAEGEHEARKVRRAAMRSVEKQMKADFTKLSRSQQARYTAQVSIMQTVVFMTKEAQIAKIADRATPKPEPISTKHLLSMFAKNPATVEGV